MKAIDRTRRLSRVLLVEKRLPIALYKYYYGFLKKLGKPFVNVRSANGLVFHGYTDSMFMFHEVWSKKEYDIPGFSLERGMTVVDIGANQGFFALYAASKGATVYAFEPCSENFEILKRNVETNRLGNEVKMFNEAVTDKSGNVPLFVARDVLGEIESATVSTSNPSGSANERETRYVSSITLDSIISSLKAEKCDLLKIDCGVRNTTSCRVRRENHFRK